MRRTLLWLALVVALVAAACSNGEGDTTTTTITPTTVTTTTVAPATSATVATTTSTTVAEPAVTFTGADGVESEITDASRIVSLAGDITETLFALGEGGRVVAIDVTTTFPAEATELPVVGFAQQLAAEPVLAFGPTLVLGDQLTGPAEAIEQIRQAGVPVVIFESQTNFDAATSKIRDIAAVIGENAAGEALADTLAGEIQEAVDLAAGANTEPRVAFVYTRGPQTLLIFGLGLPTQAMIEGAGAVDAGVASGIRGAPPLTAEGIVAAAPDVIVLPEAGVLALGGVEAFKALPGISDTPAGQNDAFLVYDEAFFFNLGPRAGQALDQFVRDLYPDLAG